MTAWLKRKLRGLLDRLEPPAREADRAEELRYAKAQLQLLKQDQDSLAAMLEDKKDSFHHSIASGTTAHAEGLAERTARLEARIVELESDIKEAS